ncbi:unnamed protein product [Pleuronectes platessa]|uniref:Uncharacterized protein n=1 Tax=Pleuronectes platessa TaxID=8262 RepID=A0A9N7Y784_PLEPL|nr:unnamed protein product [Pleuronectes platessa]
MKRTKNKSAREGLTNTATVNGHFSNLPAGRRCPDKGGPGEQEFMMWRNKAGRNYWKHLTRKLRTCFCHRGEEVTNVSGAAGAAAAAAAFISMKDSLFSPGELKQHFSETMRPHYAHHLTGVNSLAPECLEPLADWCRRRVRRTASARDRDGPGAVAERESDDAAFKKCITIKSKSNLGEGFRPVPAPVTRSALSTRCHGACQAAGSSPDQGADILSSSTCHRTKHFGGRGTETSLEKSTPNKK